MTRPANDGNNPGQFRQFHGFHRSPDLLSFPVRSFFSLLLALIILVTFGGVAFFFWHLSAEARFERTDKPVESGTQ